MRLITWNSQGKGLEGYKWRLKQYKPDVMVVQECGNLGNHFPVPVAGEDDKAVEAGTYHGYHFWWVDWSRQGANSNNARCSMAMIYKGGGVPSLMVSGKTEKRPVMFKTIGGYWVVCNIHAGGRDYIREVIDKRTSLAYGKEFVIAGDFNQHPINLDAWALEARMHVVCSGNYTRPQSHAELDYAISSQDGKANLMEHYLGSDHISVVIDFK
jgi:endonuclease/exonuclease/phosphatase family metal-dependent hydrolase